MNLPALRCAACGTLAIPPAFVCPRCGADELEPASLSGRGRIVSWTTIYMPPAAFAAEAPYDVAIVALEEGPRVTGRLRPGSAPDFDVPVRLVALHNGGYVFAREGEE
jgi:hypothetical protein